MWCQWNANVRFSFAISLHIRVAAKTRDFISNASLFQNENCEEAWSVCCVLSSLQTWRTRAIHTIVRCSFSREKSSTIFVYICTAEAVMRPNRKWPSEVIATKVQLDLYRFFSTMFFLLVILRTNKRNGTRLSMFLFFIIFSFVDPTCKFRCTNTPKSQIGDNSGGNVRSLCALLVVRFLFADVFVIIAVCLQSRIHTRTRHAIKMNTSGAPS